MIWGEGLAGGDPFKKLGRNLMRGSVTAPSRINYIDIVAHRIAKNAKKRVPVRTGALRRSIRVSAAGSTRVKTVREVGAGGEGTGVMYAAAIEFGRYSRAPHPPQPYLRPALYEEIKKTDKELKAALQAEFDRLQKFYRGVI